MPDYANYFRKFRDITGLTQKDLAGLVGFDGSYIGKIEGGEISPSELFLDNFGKVFHLRRASIYRFMEKERRQNARV